MEVANDKAVELSIKRFPEKLRAARNELGLSQTELAAKVGITQRSMTQYERGAAIPRDSTIRKLCKALGVTFKYMTNDDSNDPQDGMDRERVIENARDKFGARYASKLNGLLDETIASFAGGDVPDEDMDAFTEAFMTAIAMGKEQARKKFTPKVIQDKWAEE